MEPLDHVEKWCEETLRGTYSYKPLPLKAAARKGLDLQLLREYLACLEMGKGGTACSAILLQKYGFKAVFVGVAYKNDRGIIEVLRKYIDCLEAKKPKK